MAPRMESLVEKAVIDRTNRMIPLACKEVEDENDDEDEDDWGSVVLVLGLW